MAFGAAKKERKRRSKEACARPQQSLVMDVQGCTREWCMAGYGWAASGQPQVPSEALAPGSWLACHTSGLKSLKFVALYPICSESSCCQASDPHAPCVL